MNAKMFLVEMFGRLEPLVSSTCDQLTVEQLEFRPDPKANSIGWLIWHLTRVQDDHLADLADKEQVWVKHGWAERFDLDLTPEDTGYGHTSDQVAKVRGVTPELLRGYYRDTAAQTYEIIQEFVESDLGRVIDASWDEPVTVGIRLASVLGDCFEHVGQAAYVRGLIERSG